MSYSRAEENYLKAIYHLSLNEEGEISTNSLAEVLDTKASSITDMMKKLSAKGLISYKKYKGVKLTAEGKKIAVEIIRKHRLWEVFLVNKLNFKWDEVHELAEQLEHIKSKKLTNRLDEFLEFPKFDPHGDPIPDKKGNIPVREKTIYIWEMNPGKPGVLIGVNDSQKEFLQYLEEMNLNLGVKIEFIKKFTFDNSSIIKVDDKEVTISSEVAKRLLIKEV